MKKLCTEKLQGAVIYDIGNLCMLSVAFLLSMFTALLAYPYPKLRWGGLCIVIITVSVFHKKIIGLFQKEPDLEQINY